MTISGYLRPALRVLAALSTCALMTAAQAQMLPPPGGNAGGDAGNTGAIGNTGTIGGMGGGIGGTGGAMPPPAPAGNQGGNVAPPPPPNEGLRVFVASNGQTSGPFDANQLKLMLQNGAMTSQSYVWMDGMADWAPAHQVPKLAALLQQSDPTGDATAFLVGGWRLQTTNTMVGGSPAHVNATVQYRGNGQFAAQGLIQTMNANNPDSIEFQASGTWKASSAGPGKIRIETSYTTKFKSIITGNQQEIPTNENEVFDIVDKRSFRDEDGNVYVKVN